MRTEVPKPYELDCFPVNDSGRLLSVLRYKLPSPADGGRMRGFIDRMVRWHGRAQEPGLSALFRLELLASFVARTSTGYGDIVPLYPFARSLANREGGQLFPATLIARLVTPEFQLKNRKSD